MLHFWYLIQKRISLKIEGKLGVLYLDVCSLNSFSLMQVLQIDPLEAGCVTVLQ